MIEEQFEHENVYIDTSTIPNAGRGVFAKRNIKRGTDVCFYDGFLCDKKIDEHQYFYSACKDENGNKIWHPLNLKNQTYCQSNRKGDKCLMGYKVPKNKNGVGQLINDGSKYITPPSFVKLDDGKCEFIEREHLKSLEKYETESIKKRNVGFTNDKEFHIYAYRDIKKGEELFMMYVWSYWISHQD